MRRSTERILTTHVGSLIRPDALLPLIRAKQNGAPYDEAAYHTCLASAVEEVVRKQAAAGIDVPSDGEFGKSISWSQYALERLSGFERRPLKEAASVARGADRARFAEFYAELDRASGPPATALASVGQAVCVGPVRYTGQAEVERDIANFQGGACARRGGGGFPVAAPASVIPDRKNEYYASDDDMLQAIAEAMRVEYRAIVDAGLLLQLDDARAAVTYDRMVPPATFADYRRWLERQVQAINARPRALRPSVSATTCAGAAGPPAHHRCAAERHRGSRPARSRGRLPHRSGQPAPRARMAGVGKRSFRRAPCWCRGSSATPPTWWSTPSWWPSASRFARLVGREQVIASTDCGFAQGPFHRRVHPSIMWAKLEALAEGARLASRELWS